MIEVVILEDEAKAARELAHILRHIDKDIKILATLDSVEQALVWFSQHRQPGLIFSDIQLADGMCFDIYNQINIQSPIVFCTAFDEYMMNAFDTNAVSYILKPITREKVEKALEKCYLMKSAFEMKQDSGLAVLLKQLKYQYKTALLVNNKEKIIPVSVKDIAYFYLDRTMVTIVTIANQKYYLSSTLEEVEQLLDPAIFYRANRQFLINRSAIANAERFFARKLVAKLVVDTPETIIVSKAKASEFLHWLSGV